MRRIALLLPVLALAAAPSLGSTGPLEGSHVELVGPPPVEGEACTYRLTLVAPAPTGGDVEVRIPHAALLVRAEGLDAAEFDHDGRVLRWRGTIGGGPARELRLTVVPRADAGGQTASLHVTLRPWQGEPTYLTHSVDVASRPAPSVVTLGRVGVTAAGLAVLGWLTATGLFWLALRVVRPQSARWAPFLIMVPLGFLLYFAALAQDDLRILRLPGTTCTVTDRVLDSRTVSSSSSSARRSGPQSVYAPRLALLYAQDGQTRVAQGFGTDSRLSGASAARAETVLARYAIGARVPCAIDTRDPRLAYVERGFGGAYLFALIPLPLLALGVWGLRKHW